MFPTHRPRRLRGSEALRDMVRETRLQASDLIYPLFVQETATKPEPIASMPGQSRHSFDSLLAEVEAAAQAGVKAVMLFGIPEKKDPLGSQAYAEDGVVQRAIRRVRSEKIPVQIIGDVCLCEYTSHGHCGEICEGRVDNDRSLELLAKTAVSQARAGADLVAPSDMMDGRVGAIRRALDAESLEQVPILSYAAKYSSAFYGPFRDAAGSAPQFGDRRNYQMDPGNLREALKEVMSDIEEGADIVMVKPALAYLDVVSAVKRETLVPVAAYNVSGEYAMIEFAAQAGVIDRKKVILEMLLSMKRAGADLILSYHSRVVAGWL